MADLVRPLLEPAFQSVIQDWATAFAQTGGDGPPPADNRLTDGDGNYLVDGDGNYLIWEE